MTEFSVTIAPRFYETDALGHINNASIAAWLEIVRMQFVESLCSADPYKANNWILASLHIDFVAETFFGADVVGRVTESVPGNTSLTVVCELFQGDKLTVKGRAVLVYVNASSNRPERLPDSLREGVLQYGA